MSINNNKTIKKEFEYVVINKYKNKIDGIIERENIGRRREILKIQGNLISIKEKKNFLNLKGSLNSSYKLNLSQRIEFFEELMVSEEIGISVKDSVCNTKNNNILNIQIRNLRSVVYNDLEKGSTLSNSLKKRSIPEFICEIIKTGEERGKLIERYQSVIEIDRMKTDVNSAIKSIFFVPSIYLVIASILYYVIGTVMMPKTKEGFLQITSNVEKFPPNIKIIFGVYDHIGLYISLFYILTIGSFVLFISFYKYSKDFKMFVNKKLLTIPVINKFILLRDLVIISRMLSLTISSGLNVFECIEKSTNQISNIYTKSKMQNIYTLVKNGKQMSEAMRETNFDGTLTIVVRQGEIRGQDKFVRVLNRTSNGFIKKIYLNIEKLKDMKSSIQTILMAIIFLPLILSLLMPNIELMSFRYENEIKYR